MLAAGAFGAANVLSTNSSSNQHVAEAKEARDGLSSDHAAAESSAQTASDEAEAERRLQDDQEDDLDTLYILFGTLLAREEDHMAQSRAIVLTQARLRTAYLETAALTAKVEAMASAGSGGHRTAARRIRSLTESAGFFVRFVREIRTSTDDKPLPTLALLEVAGDQVRSHLSALEVTEDSDIAALEDYAL